jgi:hypothetical protein
MGSAQGLLVLVLALVLVLVLLIAGWYLRVSALYYGRLAFYYGRLWKLPTRFRFLLWTPLLWHRDASVVCNPPFAGYQTPHSS